MRADSRCLEKKAKTDGDANEDDCARQVLGVPAAACGDSLLGPADNGDQVGQIGRQLSEDPFRQALHVWHAVATDVPDLRLQTGLDEKASLGFCAGGGRAARGISRFSASSIGPALAPAGACCCDGVAVNGGVRTALLPTCALLSFVLRGRILPSPQRRGVNWFTGVTEAQRRCAHQPCGQSLPGVAVAVRRSETRVSQSMMFDAFI